MYMRVHYWVYDCVLRNFISLIRFFPFWLAFKTMIDLLFPYGPLRPHRLYGDDDFLRWRVNLAKLFLKIESHLHWTDRFTRSDILTTGPDPDSRVLLVIFFFNLVRPKPHRCNPESLCRLEIIFGEMAVLYTRVDKNVTSDFPSHRAS